jgi:hypothetical protein
MESPVKCWPSLNSTDHLDYLYRIRMPPNGPNEVFSSACVSGPSKPDVEGHQRATCLPRSHATLGDGWCLSSCGPPILASIPLLSDNANVSSTPRPLAHSWCATTPLDIVNEQHQLRTFLRHSFLPHECPAHLIDHVISLTTPWRPLPGPS